MLTSLLALVLFLGFWLRGTYRDASLVMTEKGNLLYQEAVRQVQDSVYQKFIVRFVENAQRYKGNPSDTLLQNFSMIDLGTAKETQIIVHRSTDSLPLKRSNKLQLSFKLDTIAQQDTHIPFSSHARDLSFPSRLRSLRAEQNDSIIIAVAPNDLGLSTERLSTTRREGFILGQDDTAPIIEKKFRQALAKAGLPAEFHIEQQQVKEDSIDLDFFPGNFNTHLQEKIVFDHTGWYLSKKIAGPFFFSLSLFLLTALAFWSLRKSSSKALQYTRLKQDFMSNMTHELKTPITTIGLAIEAIQGFVANNDQEKTREYLKISQHELSRLSLLVDKVLKLSLFENDVPRINKVKVDFELVLQKVLNAMSIQVEQTGGIFKLETAGDDFLLAADAVHLSNVLFNLLDNSLKYTEGAPIIHLKLEAQAARIIFTISDNGIGISPVHQSKVFDRFFRVPQQGHQHNVKGYGLGLSYVADIIRQHDGKITLDSTPGKGSSFRIELPR